MIEDFEFDPMLSLKESANEKDLHHLLMHLWTQKYINIPWSVNLFNKASPPPLVALTNVRPSAIIESGCRRGTNEALLYLDVVLRLVRDPENSSQTVLLMEVTLKH